MTPEEKSLLERTYKLTEENNGLLHSMRRSNRLANIMRVAYWVVILLLSFGAFYFIQPYINSLLGAFQGTGTSTGAQDSVQSTVDLLKSLLK